MRLPFGEVGRVDDSSGAGRPSDVGHFEVDDVISDLESLRRHVIRSSAKDEADVVRNGRVLVRAASAAL